MSDHNSTDALVGFGVGLLVGALAGVLLAPGSGTETRDRIGDFAKDLREKAKGGAESAGEFAKDQAQRLGHAFQEGREAYARASKEKS
jgi:gas vesicle protein